jgi:hypothetical protein
MLLLIIFGCLSQYDALKFFQKKHLRHSTDTRDLHSPVSVVINLPESTKNLDLEISSSLNVAYTATTISGHNYPLQIIKKQKIISSLKIQFNLSCKTLHRGVYFKDSQLKNTPH